MGYSAIEEEKDEEEGPFFTQPPAYEDGTDCSEKSAHKIQRPGINPEESIQHLEHGESLKSRRRTKFVGTYGQ